MFPIKQEVPDDCLQVNSSLIDPILNNFVQNENVSPTNELNPIAVNAVYQMQVNCLLSANLILQQQLDAAQNKIVKLEKERIDDLKIATELRVHIRDLFQYVEMFVNHIQIKHCTHLAPLEIDGGVGRFIGSRLLASHRNKLRFPIDVMEHNEVSSRLVNVQFYSVEFDELLNDKSMTMVIHVMAKTTLNQLGNKSFLRNYSPSKSHRGHLLIPSVLVSHTALALCVAYGYDYESLQKASLNSFFQNIFKTVKKEMSKYLTNLRRQKIKPADTTEFNDNQCCL